MTAGLQTACQRPARAIWSLATGEFRVLHGCGRLATKLTRVSVAQHQTKRPPYQTSWEQTAVTKLIRWSIGNRFLVLLATLIVAAWGVYSVIRTPRCLAGPVGRTGHYPHDLSGAGAAHYREPDHLPLATTMLSVPGAKTVRGYSFFGDSFVYVLFEDGTNLYWARSLCYDA